jgi:hypothetical protein
MPENQRLIYYSDVYAFTRDAPFMQSSDAESGIFAALHYMPGQRRFISREFCVFIKYNRVQKSEAR